MRVLQDITRLQFICHYYNFQENLIIKSYFKNELKSRQINVKLLTVYKDVIYLCANIYFTMFFFVFSYIF